MTIFQFSPKSKIKINKCGEERLYLKPVWDLCKLPNQDCFNGQDCKIVLTMGPRNHAGRESLTQTEANYAF